MGAIINHSIFRQYIGGKKKRSAISLSTFVADQCINALSDPDLPIDCFINTGIYRDKDIGEPAIATLIHGKMRQRNTNPFCFDLSNGQNGVIHAFEIFDNLIKNGQARNAMVVSGDARPNRKDRFLFPYFSAASAIIISSNQEVTGFSGFFHQSFPEYYDSYIGQLQWNRQKNGKKSHHELVIEANEDYAHQTSLAYDHALGNFFQATKTNEQDFDLLISTLDNPQILTASLGKGISQSLGDGSFQKARNIILIAVGAGIEVSIAWYKNYKDG